MDMDKEKLIKMREFLNFVKMNYTLREKKGILILSLVDMIFIGCFMYELFDNPHDIEGIVHSLTGVGVTSGILLGMGLSYNSIYKEKINDKERNRK